MKRLEIPNPKSKIQNNSKITNPNDQNNNIQWKVVLEGKKTGQDNMDVDMELFKECKITTVRIYGWEKPCISLGYSQTIEEEIDMDKAAEYGVDIVKRPTGGGIAFHTTEDVAYSVVAPIDILPKGLGPSYLYISQIVLKSLNKIGINAEIINSHEKFQIPNDKSQTNHKFQVQNPKKKSSLCFSSVLPHEIVVSGKKLVGSAQKRGRRYLLQQGAISVSRPDEKLLSAVKNKNEIDNMINSTVFINDINDKKYTFEMVSETLAGEFRSFY